MRVCQPGPVDLKCSSTSGKSAIGIYRAEPSKRGGMNWLPRRVASEIVTSRKITLTAMVSQR